MTDQEGRCVRRSVFPSRHRCPPASPLPYTSSGGPWPLCRQPYLGVPQPAAPSPPGTRQEIRMTGHLRRGVVVREEAELMYQVSGKG